MVLEEFCPRMLWRIDNFSSVTSKKSSSFRYLEADWQWEYVVHVDDQDHIPAKKSEIFLRRLTCVCTGKKIGRFVSFVYIKNPDGKRIFEQMYNYDMEPLDRWLVFEVGKDIIVEKELIWKDCCTFSCSIEPLGTYEEMASLETELRSSTLPCLQSLSEDFGKVFKDFASTDITLKCEDMPFLVHKGVLASRSQKFADLIGAIDATYPPDFLTLTDIQPKVLKDLIRYIYTGNICLSIELAEHIYRASNEYGIQPLRKRCALFIIENLSFLKPCNVLVMAEECKDNYLKNAVASHIANDVTFLSSEEWKDFSSSYRILAIDVFRIFVQRSHFRDSYF